MSLFKSKLSNSLLLFIILFGVFQLFDLNRRLLRIPSDASYEVFNIADQSAVDERIFLINISNSSSGDINRLLDTLLSFEPKIVGVDLSGCRAIRDSISHLKRNSANSLIVFKDNSELKNSFDTNKDTIRTFIQREFEKSYEGEIVKAVDPKAINNLIKRNNQFELIHFSGFVPRYYEADTHDILERMHGRDIIESKIVLLGDFGDNTMIFWSQKKNNNPQNTFRTPIHYGKEKDKSNMYGTHISANIISTVLDGSYINQISSFQYLILVLLLVVVHILLLNKISIQWYWLIAYILFITESIGESSLIIFIFAKTNYLIDPGYSQYIFVSSFFAIYFYRIIEKKLITLPTTPW